MRQLQKIRLHFAGVVLLAVFSTLIAYPRVVVFWPAAESFLNRAKINLGLDLQGGIHLEYAADTKEIDSGKTQDALNAAVAVIERRVNAFGVGEALVQLSRSGDEHRIIVELPGVKDIEQAKQMIKETPFLEFREPAGPEAQNEIDAYNAQSQSQALAVLHEAKSGADFAKLAETWSQDPGSKNEGGVLDFARRGNYLEAFDDVVFNPDFKTGSVWPEVVETSFGWHVIKKLDERGTGDEREVKVAHVLLPKYSLSMFPDKEYKPTGLSGKNLKDAVVDYRTQGVGSPQIALRFDDEGARLFADLTKRSIGKPIAIFLDGEIISAPVVQSEILDGRAVITGNFTMPEATALVKRFNEGALPVPITLVGQQSVDASLGTVALHQSLIAGFIGLAAVSVFMLLFYRFLGFIAVLALLLYSAMLLTLFKLSAFTPFPITLTLSGIAGFILSIGIAVDANVLIFERTREELAFGKNVRTALTEGFRRAWPSIRDGHVSTLITTVILIGMGSGFVKGFAIILALGVVLSLFTAVILVRSMIAFLLTDWLVRHPALLVTPKGIPHITPPTPPL